MRLKVFLKIPGISFLILLICLGAVFVFRDSVLNLYSKFFERFPEAEKVAYDFLPERVKKESITPGPLYSPEEDPDSFLTQSGIIQWTNIHREKNGLLALTENTRLNIAAETKIEDMFESQYFAHVSPSGEKAADLAESAAYEFIVIGENLAMGNFKDAKELVQAWMDSPGHRANILNSLYQDIGIAVGRGLFEEKSTWLAVQIFGLPLSFCPQPDEFLKEKIESYEIQLKQLQIQIESLLAEIKSIQPKRGSVYNKKVNEYNELINQYNSLLDLNRSLIDRYNAQVKLFNDCAIK